MNAAAFCEAAGDLTQDVGFSLTRQHLTWGAPCPDPSALSSTRDCLWQTGQIHFFSEFGAFHFVVPNCSSPAAEYLW